MPNTPQPTGEVPVFNPSAETELLCQDLCKDANGRVFAHLLRQVDVAKQQNGHIIREQMQAAAHREKLIDGFREHTVEFKKHELNDVAEFKGIREAITAGTVSLAPTVQRVESWSKWLDFIFSRNGIVAGIVGAVVVPLLVNLAAANYKAKLDAAVVTASKTNSVTTIKP